MFGVGSIYTADINVQVGKKNIPIFARMKLFGSDIGIVQSPTEHAGKLLLPRWEELIRLLPEGMDRREYRWKPEDLRCQLVGSLYRALRQQLHVLNNLGLHYGYGEWGRIADLRQLGLRANAIALGLRTGASEEKESDLNLVGHEILSRLGEPRNFPKLEARQFTLEFASGRDRRGWVNETVTMTRALAASDRFRERIEDGILRIRPVVAQRESVLISLSLLTESQIRVTLDFLEHLLKLRTDQLQRRNIRESIGRRLEQLSQELRRYDFHPFVRAFGFTCAELSAAAGFAKQGNWGTMLTVLRRSRESLRLQLAHIQLERLLYMVTEKVLGLRPKEGAERFRMRVERVSDGFARVQDAGFQVPVLQALTGPLQEAKNVCREEGELDYQILRDALKEAAECLDG